MSLVLVGGHLALAFSPVFLSLFTGVIGTVLCYVAFGFLANGIVNLLHALAHFQVFSKRASNHFLGQYILGPLFLSDFESYRERHWQHHLNLGSEKDPKIAYRLKIQNWNLIPFLMECLFLFPAVRLLRKHEQRNNEACSKSKGKAALTLFLPHVLLCLCLALVCNLAGRPILVSVLKAYGFVYLYGLGSLTVFAATVRAVAEHHITDAGEMRFGEAALRTMKCNWFTRLILGSYGFEYHAAHHLSPSVPYYHLEAQTRFLAKTQPSLARGVGYMEVLLDSPGWGMTTQSVGT
jgi:fatty acid desaturase